MPRHGVHKALEDEADRILREALAGVTSQSEKRDVLTPWKEQDRRSREVYTPSGSPDGSLRRGMYHRAYNPASPHLNSRDSGTRGRRVTDSIQQHIETNGGSVFDPDTWSND